MGIFDIFKRRKKQNETFSINVLGKDYDNDVSQKSFQNRKIERDEEDKSAWQVKNFESDNYRVHGSERELVGFYGQKVFSNNRHYCVVFVDGDSERVTGKVALVDTITKKMLYKINVKRPHKCEVTDTGLVACNDWKGWGKESSTFWVFDTSGKAILQQNLRQILGDTCLISNDGMIACFDVSRSWQYYLIDVAQNKVFKKVSKEYTTETSVDIEKRVIVLKYDDENDKIIDF